MDDDRELSRREFLGRAGAGAVAGAAAAHSDRKTGKHSGKASPAVVGRPNATGAWAPPPTLTNPNILVIVVDQLRLPMWLSSSQSTTVDQTILPNISGRIMDKAYNFQQYFVAATACTPSRSTLLTGLYVPQTAMFLGDNSGTAPSLNPAFATWAGGLALLNSAYRGNVWWFGKWHLSYKLSASPLMPYGFNTRTYPGGSAGNPSPNGYPNQGINGGSVTTGPLQGEVWASDAQITSDFLSWLQGQSSSSPWCATVSLINPHDISFAPAWVQSSPFPPTNVNAQLLAYFPPPSGSPPALYSNLPAGFNYENLAAVTSKPGLQLAFQQGISAAFGAVTNWPSFLNQYYWFQSFADQQIGLILDALYSSPFATNTIVVFTSDHGDYAGSHGLHDKGGAAYDEGIRVPLSILFPGQTSSVSMNQMCSSVDFFGLVCDLGARGSGQWRLAYPDLAKRQSIWSFLNSNGSETRVAPAPVGLPYILNSFDELKSNEDASNLNYAKSHVLCIRTKHDPASGVIGAKLGIYSKWANCTSYPDASPPDSEFYDYNPATANNASELGNDFYSNNAGTQSALASHTQALGAQGPNQTGIVANEFNAPLVGKGPDGTPLAQTRASAIQAFVNFAASTSCSG